ncbi:hypothetical protein BC835DRAFT_1307565 [Cytidiella melzeri]|nr:hypothetical protein BC835DRAFT_1307565 [Cytidiella melzeri]
MQDTVVVYIDGFCIHIGAANARTGAGVWFGPNYRHNLAIRVPGRAQTNQAGEILVIQKAAKLAPTTQPLHTISSSQYMIDGLTQRAAITTFGWVKGHSGLAGKDSANKLGSLQDPPDNLDLIFTIPDKWNLTGVKTSALSQAIAYAGITLSKQHTTHPAEANLDRTYHYCDAPECTRIWMLCVQLWAKKAPTIPWPGKHIGNLLGAPPWPTSSTQTADV